MNNWTHQDWKVQALTASKEPQRNFVLDLKKNLELNEKNKQNITDLALKERERERTTVDHDAANAFPFAQKRCIRLL